MEKDDPLLAALIKIEQQLDYGQDAAALRIARSAIECARDDVAPDLLEALKALILDERNAAIIERHCIGGPTIANMARAAIDRATGSS